MDSAVRLNVPSHAPSVLHGVSLVLILAQRICHSTIADLEGHHPGGAIGVQSIVIRLGNVVLDEYANSFALIVYFRNLLHLLIEDECMLISEDHEAGSI